MSHIVVIGAGMSLDSQCSLGFLISITGVVGLSTAIRIQEIGHKVTILAEHLPGDKKTIEYASPWAVRTSPSLMVE
jgi:hypothetical protein